MKNARQIEGSGGLEKVSDALLRWRRRSCYGMSQILPNLYVGSMRDANDIDQLKEKQIHYILSIHGLTRPCTALSEANVLHIHMADLPEANISEHFHEAIVFIHRARLQNTYLIVTCELTYAAALAYIANKRPCANPNFGFRMQLAKYAEKKAPSERLIINNRFDSDAIRELKQNDRKLFLDYPATSRFDSHLHVPCSVSHDWVILCTKDRVDSPSTATQSPPRGSCIAESGSQNIAARATSNDCDISFIDQ